MLKSGLIRGLRFLLAVGAVVACAPAWAEVRSQGSTGFQLALRSGASFPAGDAFGGYYNNSLSSGFGFQVPLWIDIGGKPNPHFFAGGYAAVNVGDVGDAVSRTCVRGISCSTLGFRFGAEMQYHFLPAGSLNPWLGYGLGLEWNSIQASVPGASASNTFFGFELAHLMAGLDFRLDRDLGIGPFLDVALGEYIHQNLSNSSGADHGLDISDKALHGWITVGIRGVLFP